MQELAELLDVGPTREAVVPLVPHFSHALQRLDILWDLGDLFCGNFRSRSPDSGIQQ